MFERRLARKGVSQSRTVNVSLAHSHMQCYFHGVLSTHPCLEFLNNFYFTFLSFFLGHCQACVEWSSALVLLPLSFFPLGPHPTTIYQGGENNRQKKTWLAALASYSNHSLHSARGRHLGREGWVVYPLMLLLSCELKASFFYIILRYFSLSSLSVCPISHFVHCHSPPPSSLLPSLFLLHTSYPST